MVKRLTALLLMALLLSGCSWMDGSYVYVEPHHAQQNTDEAGTVSASNYPQLMGVMEDLVTAGTEHCIINVSRYNQNSVDNNMAAVCRYVMEMFPIGAYAVENIEYEVGTNSGRPAIAVDITYRRSRMEIQQIRRKPNMDEAEKAIFSSLEDNASRVVMLVESYTHTDFDQLIQEYAREHPQTVMEVPQVSTGLYGAGGSRVVELNFTYQNSRESLRQMQVQVRPVFEAAVLYVSGEAADHQKFAQLSSFLTERFDYQMGTSITPSYSLLCHGVGDSRIFAEVYASMCRRAGLTCMIVTGTRGGEPWTWNMVCDDGRYFHVDLLRGSQEGGFREYTDLEMADYVWDYSAYPACDASYQQTPESAAPVTEETEPTDPAPEETEPAALEE